jgi:hypothetical protein
MSDEESDSKPGPKVEQCIRDADEGGPMFVNPSSHRQGLSASFVQCKNYSYLFSIYIFFRVN